MYKLKIGNRLLTAREERKLNQSEMSDLLGVSPSTYSRLERNETSVELEQVVGYAKILQIPVQEFLPDTLSIHSNNQNGQVGMVIGNVYHYGNKEDAILALEKELKLKEHEVISLQEKLVLLEEKITNLEEIASLLRNQK